MIPMVLPRLRIWGSEVRISSGAPTLHSAQNCEHSSDQMRATGTNSRLVCRLLLSRPAPTLSASPTARWHLRPEIKWNRCRSTPCRRRSCLGSQNLKFRCTRSRSSYTRCYRTPVEESSGIRVQSTLIAIKCVCRMRIGSIPGECVRPIVIFGDEQVSNSLHLVPCINCTSCSMTNV
jgi:hypothetical protein